MILHKNSSIVEDKENYKERNIHKRVHLVFQVHAWKSCQIHYQTWGSPWVQNTDWFIRHIITNWQMTFSDQKLKPCLDANASKLKFLRKNIIIYQYLYLFPKKRESIKDIWHITQQWVVDLLSKLTNKENGWVRWQWPVIIILNC